MDDDHPLLQGNIGEQRIADENRGRLARQRDQGRLVGLHGHGRSGPCDRKCDVPDKGTDGQGQPRRAPDREPHGALPGLACHSNLQCSGPDDAVEGHRRRTPIEPKIDEPTSIPRGRV